MSPASLVTADWNGDGRLDLAVGNQGSSDISILLGRGDGTFQDQLTNPVGNRPAGVVTADLNHDGHTDIITANYYSNDISVLLGNGDGTFQPARSFPAGEDPTALAVADFNGDGRLDVAVADSGDGNNDKAACRSCWATATVPSRTRPAFTTGYPVVDRGRRLHGQRHARPRRRQ